MRLPGQHRLVLCQHFLGRFVWYGRTKETIVQNKINLINLVPCFDRNVYFLKMKNPKTKEFFEQRHQLEENKIFILAKYISQERWCWYDEKCQLLWLLQMLSTESRKANFIQWYTYRKNLTFLFFFKFQVLYPTQQLPLTTKNNGQFFFA